MLPNHRIVRKTSNLWKCSKINEKKLRNKINANADNTLISVIVMESL